MAGGVGSRFWPLSKASLPKQFIDILGTGKTLLQQTYERFLTVCPNENIYIVSNIEYGKIIKAQLPDIGEYQMMLEPMRKNTAPCIAYANYRIKQINEEANIIVAPSDHFITNEDKFFKTLVQGLEFVQNNDALLTLGIRPSRPETGYGYIQVNKHSVRDENPDLMKVKTFTEKPDMDLAKVFLKSGDFFWNSGIFLWSLKSIQKAFDKHLVEVSSLFNDIETGLDPEKEAKSVLIAYSDTRNISIDYGIMEKADNVFALCSEFGWSDLGTWSSMYDHSEKDMMGNVISAENAMLYDSKNCIVNVSGEKLVVLQGLENYIVVETEKTLLICKREEEQKIKQIVNDVKISKGEEYI